MIKLSDKLKAIEETYGINRDSIITVDQLSMKLEKVIKQSFSDALTIMGEIISINRWKDNYFFITIKGKNTSITCMHRENNFDLKEGEEVLVIGTIDYYLGKSNVRIRSKKILPVGEGIKSRKLRILKEKLRKEGLFDRKRELPLIPTSIGLISSERGKAVHDVVETIKKRFPHVKVLFCPSFVQGKEAFNSIVSAIKILNIKKVDEIIIARGGGSNDDFDCFNDETVVREIFNSKIPTITAIGHHSDSTVADLVSDKSAITPTEAAKIAVPEINSLLNEIESRKRILEKNYESQITKHVHSHKIKKYQIALLIIFIILIIIFALLVFK